MSRPIDVLEQPCRFFSMSELILATNNFDEKWCIGRGGFGKVYKGKISDESTDIYAIKRLHLESHQGAPEFWVEVELLSRLRHCNLVSLVGYCNKEKEMALVYEYMPNGTLYDHLHKIGTALTWSQWLKICIGAARGLDYLHTGTGTQHGVIHRDVKSSNILLDQNYAAKIADFGLAKTGPTNQTCTYVITTVKGTFGYMDPNYFYTGKMTRKSDVYAFGVVLLEELSGRPAVDESLDEGLAIWAQNLIKQGKLSQIVSSSLRDHISKSSLKEFTGIAVQCLLSHPNQRPTMSEAVGSLDRALSFQERNTSSSLGGIAIKNVWSLFSLKGHLDTKSSGTDGSKKISNVGPTATFTGFPEIKQSIWMSSNDDRHSESSSLNGGGGLGVKLVKKYISDHLRGNPTSNSVNNASHQVEEVYKPGLYIKLLDSRDGIDEIKRSCFSVDSIPPVQDDEWNEVYEPGVLITFSRYRDGTRELRRVHFSRMKFEEHKASKWWLDNRENVYERYNVSLSNDTKGKYCIGPYWTLKEHSNSKTIDEFWTYWRYTRE